MSLFGLILFERQRCYATRFISSKRRRKKKKILRAVVCARRRTNNILLNPEKLTYLKQHIEVVSTSLNVILKKRKR